ncbi:MAG: acyltransferase [Treponema sp.]|nr:acyltransferase [Treponema sp.]
MRKPYKTPIVTASPDLQNLEPNITRLVRFLLKVFGGIYLFLYFGIVKIVLRGDEYLFDAYKRALEGKSRCILAFRHPNGGEPQLLTIYFLFKLRKLAARKKFRFPMRPHSVFVYSYDVVRWGGWVSRLIMPGVGAMPIYHAKLDSKSMSRIFGAIADGPYPLALAPEGKVSYTTDSVPKLEQGVIRIGFQAAERLAEKNADCPIEILPLSIHFRFGSFGNVTLERLLRRIEKACGFSRRDCKKLSFTERVRRCRDHVLQANESRYQTNADAVAGDPRPFEERLEKVIHAALDTAERILGSKNTGDVMARMHRVNQMRWDRIYIPDMVDFKGVTQVEQGILDLRAGEAWYAGQHIGMVELCWHLMVPLPREDAALHEKVECVQNLWDFASRTMGGAFKHRVNLFPRKVILQAAPVINLTERLPAYKNDKKSTIATTLSDLEKSYQECIDAVAKGAGFAGRK